MTDKPFFSVELTPDRMMARLVFNDGTKTAPVALEVARHVAMEWNYLMKQKREGRLPALGEG